MDALGSLLNGPRARDPLVLRLVFASPWALRVDDRSPLTVLVVTRGAVSVDYDDGTRSTVTTGEVALFRGSESYLVSDGGTHAPIARIDESGDCVDLDGRHSMAEHMSVGLRSWGNSAPDEATAAMLIGVYRAGEVNRTLLDALPRLSVVSMSDDPLRALMEAEITREAPGQDAVLNRYLDLILISALRRTFDDEHGGAAWFRAYRDPTVGRALRLMHNNADRRWTVESLATEVGVSRATLARRFTDLVGTSPMKHLTSWRLALAADHLAQDNPDTLGVIAERIGYATPFALSAAFKREYGVSPSQWAATSTQTG
ncbi:AraC family transcriptional regulator [Gordonia crocea]|uniref:AraC family transcriptional regulator n=1 Tax=Gordonia crocea TaxID=589162 RepID=A0A7I9UVK0_9ACTN|nr:AraC family transcriptional regulator [Gordonia crocea]GED96791.1 AraC family transcriptional regulator [Gordonia crocea]